MVHLSFSFLSLSFCFFYRIRFLPLVPTPPGQEKVEGEEKREESPCSPKGKKKKGGGRKNERTRQKTEEEEEEEGSLKNFLVRPLSLGSARAERRRGMDGHHIPLTLVKEK